MARPKRPSRMNAQQVSGRKVDLKATGMVTASSSVHPANRRLAKPQQERHTIARPWQIEAYRHLNICGEARYAASLFAAIAGRAEIGVSEPHALARKAVWVTSGEEVDAFNELAPTVRERAKLIRDYMLHRIVAGECYLIARERQETDPEYETRRHSPVWEIVAVTELRQIGDRWEVRFDNNDYVMLAPTDPIIRLWDGDPADRREAWSPFRSMLPTLREIEWLTKHIFTQVRSRLHSAGVWFLPDNITFPPPPPSAVDGGAEALAAMNEAEQFMVSLAASGMQQLEDDEVSFPTIVMADPVALANVDQSKLIEFWSELDDKAIHMRSDAVRRFALGMDLPPEQVLGSSGLAVTGASGSGNSVNHWGVWANEEQTISAHVEPALDDFTAALTSSFLRVAVEGTDKVIGYDTATLRLRQDRSKEAMEWYDRGVLSADVALRENGFDPTADQMDDAEFKRWLLTKIAGGSATPEQVNESLRLLGVVLNIPMGDSGGDSGGGGDAATRQPGRNNPPSLKEHPYEGPPRVQHDHSPAPYAVRLASADVLVLRALEKYGNRLVNNGKRGRDKDRTSPVHLAHVVMSAEKPAEPEDFDFSLASTVFSDMKATTREATEAQLARYCANLVNTNQPHTREALSTWMAWS